MFNIALWIIIAILNMLHDNTKQLKVTIILMTIIIVIYKLQIIMLKM